MSRVLVLGAGFGGITAARELRARLPPSHQVTLIDRRPDFLMGLAKLWALDGRRPIERGRRPYKRLRPEGIEFVHETISAIDLVGRRVKANGESFPYDRLILALGAELAPELLPGFDLAHNLYHADGVTRLGPALASFQGGRILFTISSLPFKCPPAPYEAAMLTASLLARQGVRNKTTIELTTPEPRPLPVAAPPAGEALKALLRERGIQFTPDHKPRAIHAESRVVEYENGQMKPFDLLIGVPPHRAPAVVQNSGLADASGWIPVDPKTLRTSHAGVYAVGDVTILKTPSGKPIPKAGILAEAEARVAAANVADEILGRAPTATFDGKGYCYLELGDGLAAAVDGEFFATPEPVFTFRSPGEGALREKEGFESERLEAWFGS